MTHFKFLPDDFPPNSRSTHVQTKKIYIIPMLNQTGSILNITLENQTTYWAKNKAHIIFVRIEQRPCIEL